MNSYINKSRVWVLVLIAWRSFGKKKRKEHQVRGKSFGRRAKKIRWDGRASEKRKKLITWERRASEEK